jgi:hypothetical protein
VGKVENEKPKLARPSLEQDEDVHKRRKVRYWYLLVGAAPFSGPRKNKAEEFDARRKTLNTSVKPFGLSWDGDDSNETPVI